MANIMNYHEKVEFENKGEIWLYYNGDILALLAEQKIKDELGIDVEIEVIYDDITEYGLYFLDIYDFLELDDDVVDKLSDKYYSPDESSFEFTRNILGSIFDNFGEYGEVEELMGMDFERIPIDLPVKFTKPEYNHFMKTLMEKGIK